MQADATASPGVIEEDLRIDLPGRAGESLAATIAYPATAAARALPVLLCSPHPNFGGDRHNNVLRAVARHLAERGWLVLRFDYHGIGGSSRGCDGTLSMIDHWVRVEADRDHSLALRDARAAFARLLELVGASELAIVAYSYGCVVDSLAFGASAQVRARLWLAPPYLRHSFTGGTPAGVPHWVVSGEADFLYDRAEAKRVARALPEARFVSLIGADHFFRGRESEVVELAAELLQ